MYLVRTIKTIRNISFIWNWKGYACQQKNIFNSGLMCNLTGQNS